MPLDEEFETELLKHDIPPGFGMLRRLLNFTRIQTKLRSYSNVACCTRHDGGPHGADDRAGRPWTLWHDSAAVQLLHGRHNCYSSLSRHTEQVRHSQWQYFREWTADCGYYLNRGLYLRCTRHCKTSDRHAPTLFSVPTHKITMMIHKIIRLSIWFTNRTEPNKTWDHKIIQ